jgi:hypothetical protein
MTPAIEKVRGETDDILRVDAEVERIETGIRANVASRGMNPVVVEASEVYGIWVSQAPHEGHVHRLMLSLRF